MEKANSLLNTFIIEGKVEQLGMRYYQDGRFSKTYAVFGFKRKIQSWQNENTTFSKTFFGKWGKVQPLATKTIDCRASKESRSMGKTNELEYLSKLNIYICVSMNKEQENFRRFSCD